MGEVTTYKTEMFKDKLVRCYRKACENKLDNQYDFYSLVRLRDKVLTSGEPIEERDREVFDYIETQLTTVSHGRNTPPDYMHLSRRFESSYYYSDNDPDSEIIKLMNDVKGYIYPEKFELAVKSAMAKESFNLPVYIQSLIMLGNGILFEVVIRFIKENARVEQISEIVNEITNYSKKGPLFAEYFARRAGIEISEEQRIKLRMIRLSNENFDSKSEIPRNINPKSLCYQRIFDVEIDYTKLLSCNTIGDGKTPCDIVKSETSKFDIAKVVGEGKDSKALVVITPGNYYAVGDVQEFEPTLYTVALAVDPKLELFPKPKKRIFRSHYEEYLSKCKKYGIAVIEIAKQGSSFELNECIPDRLTEYQELRLSRFRRAYDKSIQDMKEKNRPVQKAKE